jgi:hypothetical protein
LSPAAYLSELAKAESAEPAKDASLTVGVVGHKKHCRIRVCCVKFSKDPSIVVTVRLEDRVRSDGGIRVSNAKELLESWKARTGGFELNFSELDELIRVLTRAKDSLAR